MTTPFQVIDVFRPPMRRGPIIVGALPSVPVGVGDRLAFASDPTKTCQVLAVEMPTPATTAAGHVALVISPEHSAELRPGVMLEVLERPSP